jgi:hypothetical protein
MKDQVYSWRISQDLKSDLERHARSRKTPVSTILEVAVRDWLAQDASYAKDDDRQKQLHNEVNKCLGVLSGSNPNRAENSSMLIRERLKRRHGR